jgi:hypothetical protein
LVFSKRFAISCTVYSIPSLYTHILINQYQFVNKSDIWYKILSVCIVFPEKFINLLKISFRNLEHPIGLIVLC